MRAELREHVFDPGLPKVKRPHASAWVLLFFEALFVTGSSAYWLVHGRFYDNGLYEEIAGSAWSTSEALLPGIDRLVTALIRFAGGLGVLLGLFAMAVSATSYRRGETWAWYVMWILAFVPVLDLSTFGGYEVLSRLSAAWDVFLLVLALGGLFLPHVTDSDVDAA